MAFAGHKAGHHVRGVSVRQVRPEATHDTLVSTQEDTTISEGHDDLLHPPRRFLINDCRLTQLKSDKCLFYKRAVEHFMLVAIYVDGIVIACSNQSMFSSFKDKLTH